ncbi:MAG: IS91 family transposase [Inhella sp.]
MVTLAQVLRLGAEAYARGHSLSTPQARAWRGICACRTPLLGGQCLACTHCGHRHWQYHSCRNRHCPQCGARARDAWLRGRLAEVLAVPYTHLVFTLPHGLGSLYRCQPRWVIETLFASVAATLKDFAANPRWMGIAAGQPAFSLVLHTWSQDLRQHLHLHLHAVMACGVLGPEGHWHAPARRPDFLFPVQALSKVFRGKFMAALRQLAQHSELQDPNLAPAGRKVLMQHDWVVYAKTPLGGPAQVLEYLGRYTHRTAIGNERIQAITPEHEVVFTVRADAQGGKRRLRLPLDEFIRRFLLHVLPGGVQRIRHYGVLANGCKKTQLAQARASLHQPRVDKPALESAQAFLARVARIELSRCPHCRQGRLQVELVLPGLKHLPEPAARNRAEPARQRGPP